MTAPTNTHRSLIFLSEELGHEPWVHQPYGWVLTQPTLSTNRFLGILIPYNFHVADISTNWSNSFIYTRCTGTEKCDLPQKKLLVIQLLFWFKLKPAASRWGETATRGDNLKMQTPQCCIYEWKGKGDRLQMVALTYLIRWRMHENSDKWCSVLEDFKSLMWHLQLNPLLNGQRVETNK